MDYPLYFLTDEEFEDLVTLICQKILGEATVNFAKGPDGGRDAKFHGTTNGFPSATQPWSGKLVIQAKHTNVANASCADSRFQTIIKKEVLPAIHRLIKADQIEYYLLFTNRKLPGKQEENIHKTIIEETQIKNVICGIEFINLRLKEFPEIARTLSLNKLLLPLQFDEEDMKQIVLAFKDQKFREIQENIKHIEKKFAYVDIERKNKINKLSKEYFDQHMIKYYSYFESIKEFFTDPINHELKYCYDNTVDEINQLVTIKREVFGAFEEIIKFLFDFAVMNNQDLKKHKKLVNVFLHYMYCICDIGVKEND